MTRQEKFINIINDINDGNWSEHSDMFRDNFGLFLDIVKKYGLFDKLDLSIDGSLMDEYENKILFALIQSEPDKYYQYIRNEIINSDLCGDGNNFLHLNDIEDLAIFFNDSGYHATARDMAKTILSDDFWEPYQDTVHNLYDDVIDDLNDVNLKILKDKMFEVLNGTSVEADTQTLSDLITDELDDEVVISSENFDEIFNDEETVKFLFKNVSELDDISNDLHNLHTNSYNSAYIDESYRNVWNELDTYFEGKPEYHSEPNKYDSKRIRNWVTIKIRDINHLIYTWLKEEQNSTYNDDKLSYYGSYTNLLSECMNRGFYDYLDFRIPDYPDYSLIKKNLNELFSDYI